MTTTLELYRAVQQHEEGTPEWEAAQEALYAAYAAERAWEEAARWAAYEEAMATTQYVSELLVTDTRVYEVIGRTAQTMTLRTMRATDQTRVDQHVDGAGQAGVPPVVWTLEEADPNGAVMRVRRRNDGTFRLGTNPLRPIEVPERRVDYRW